MEKVNKWMTKKTIAIIGVAGIVIAYFLQHYYDAWPLLGLPQHTYIAIYKSIIWFSIPLTFVVFILFFVRDEVFLSWRKFVYAWAPFQILIVLSVIIAEWNSIGGFFSMRSAEPIALFLSFLFLSISLFLIIYKTLKTR